MMKMMAVGLAAVAGNGVFAGELSADFSNETGRVRRALHSSGFAPKVTSAGNITAQIKELNFEYTRTHDLALINAGQRIVDTHFIFPLMHLDPKDPHNYYFDATDHLLRLSLDAGLKIFYRLGTSIEHSGPKVHFNSLIPEDFDKTAEVYAGIIRHYTKGWAKGFHWDIKYWEIWNEPDGSHNMWCLPDGDGGVGGTDAEIKADKAARDAKRQALFVEFFVKCLKRIKSEFPDMKVGGPALCGYKEGYFRAILKACKEAGVAPDFISWHYYGSNPSAIINGAASARKLCDSFGFKDCELIINEWHYLGSYSWRGLRNTDPAVVKKVWEGPASHNGIDSSCFTLSTLARLQTSEYDQSYFYGCRHSGAWGYMDEHKQKYKIWYALKLFGSIMKECTVMCGSEGDKTVSTLATKSADGKTGWLLVSDYCGKSDTLIVDVKGVKGVLSATLLDHKRNNEKTDAGFEDGKLTLKKKLPGSAAFLVKFSL
jgi:hypothetical protein